MKAILEIILAILFTFGGICLSSEGINSFKRETIFKIQNGISPLEDFTTKLTR